MIRRYITAVAVAVFIATVPALAALNVGQKAPDFTLEASLGGKVYPFSLADALKKGPVVLYFYPAAFTTGCTIEAHDFAEAVDDYKKLGATVIGVSHDDIDTLKRFSVSECRSKFAVAGDTGGSVIRAYDATMPDHPEYANRTSYVIVPGGTIIYTYTDPRPDQHVENTLNALRTWKQQ